MEDKTKNGAWHRFWLNLCSKKDDGR